MINYAMKAFTLQKKVITYNDRGKQEISWEDIEEIEVSIFNDKILKVAGENTYLIHQPVGITKYDKLEKNKEYRIISSDEKYLITSFAIGRYTQLILKEVIEYEQ